MEAIQGTGSLVFVRKLKYVSKYRRCYRPAGSQHKIEPLFAWNQSAEGSQNQNQIHSFYYVAQLDLNSSANSNIILKCHSTRLTFGTQIKRWPRKCELRHLNFETISRRKSLKLIYISIVIKCFEGSKKSKFETKIFF